MEEQLISFEIAKLAKEKGFNLSTLWHYWESNGTLDKGDGDSELIMLNHNKYEDYYSAPTQSLLQKWLREKYGIDITINQHLYTSSTISGWFARIDPILPFGDDILIDGIPLIKKRSEIIIDFKTIETEDYNNYEDALEAGLKEALKLI